MNKDTKYRNEPLSDYQLAIRQEEFNRKLAAMTHLIRASEGLVDSITERIASDDKYQKTITPDLNISTDYVNATRKRLETEKYLSKKTKDQYETEKEFVRETSRRIRINTRFKKTITPYVKDGKLGLREVTPTPENNGERKASGEVFHFTKEDREKIESAIKIIINNEHFKEVNKNPDISEYMSEYQKQDKSLDVYDKINSMEIITGQQNELSTISGGLRNYPENDKTDAAFRTISEMGRKLMRARLSVNGINAETHIPENREKDAELRYDQREAVEFPTRKEKIASAFKEATSYASGGAVAVYNSAKAVKDKSVVVAKNNKVLRPAMNVAAIAGLKVMHAMDKFNGMG